MHFEPDSFYWVRLDPAAAWEVAQFSCGDWWFCGSDVPTGTERLAEIGPAITPPPR